MLRNVAAVLLDGAHPFELGVICEVFGIDRSDEGLPEYDFAVVSAEGPTLGTHVGGLTFSTPYGLDRLDEADLIAVPAGSDFVRREYPPELLEALRRATDRGARVLSVCSGVFVLGAAGLLDGRRCAVHWHHAAELRRQYPRAEVAPDVLYVDEDPVITSAGTAAGIDACLHIVRKEQGPEVANRIARRMVVPPHRDGGQAQYIERPLPRSSCDTGRRGAGLDGAAPRRGGHRRAARGPGAHVPAHLRPPLPAGDGHDPVPLDPAPARAAGAASAGGDGRDDGRDRRRTGFGTAAALRHQFVRALGTTPHAYRRTFRGPEAAA
ncbi:Helix-turn-helix domain-containing protein OS=Streptomyces tendae OX=1932 GN=GUR47_14715 PE=4 SV=1 [Streptomyces tendae]